MAEPRRAALYEVQDKVEEAQVVPPKQLEDDKKEESSEYSNDDWGATEDLFEAEENKKAKESAPAAATTKVVETVVEEIKPREESPKIDFFGIDDAVQADNIPELYPKGSEEIEPQEK